MARDDQITRWEYFEGEELTRAEEDTDGDGLVDQWERHVDGAMVDMSLDTTFERERPDRRLVYSPSGELLRVEVDSDGNGVFEPGPPAQEPAR